MALSYSVVIAAPASAAPCDSVATLQACKDCTYQATRNAQMQGQLVDLYTAGCVSGQDAGLGAGKTGYADCDAMTDAIARSNCYDEHVMGQR